MISADLEKKWAKSVQLVRVSFFWSDFLQNPYFSNKKIIIFGDNEPTNTQLKPGLMQSGP